MTTQKEIAKLGTRIDSYQFRLLLREVTLKENGQFLKDELQPYNHNTASFEGEKETRKGWFEIQLTATTKVGFKIKNVVVDGKNHEPCIIILVKSKILEGRYFEGLTGWNVKEVYDKLISLDVFYVDFETFLDGDLTDVDIKNDGLMSQGKYIELINNLKKSTRASKNNNKGFTPHNLSNNKPYNLGVSFAHRIRSTISSPYVKLYWKGGELISKSEAFYEEHLADKYSREDIIDLRRLEATIKDKKHASSLGIKSMKLRYLMYTVTEEQLSYALEKMLNKHVDLTPKVRPTKEEKALTPDEKIHVQSMRGLYKQYKEREEDLYEFLTTHIESRSTRSKKKKRLRQLFDEYVKILDLNKDQHGLSSFNGLKRA